jgi:hypothetical protein
MWYEHHSNWHVHNLPWTLWNWGLQNQTWASLNWVLSTWHINLLWIQIACHKLQWWTLCNTQGHKHDKPWWPILKHAWHDQTSTKNSTNHH